MAEQPKTRRIRIEHDGSMNPINVKVLDAETGELVQWVQRVEFVADARGELTAVVFVHAPELDVTVDAEIRDQLPESHTAEIRIVNAVMARLAPTLYELQRAIEGKKGDAIGPFFDVGHAHD